MGTQKKEDITKLPKWAQDRIAILKRDVEWWKGQAEKFGAPISTTDDAYAPRTVSYRHGFDHLRIPENGTIVFGFGNRDYIEVRYGSWLVGSGADAAEALIVRGSRGLGLRPEVSNAVRVALTED